MLAALLVLAACGGDDGDDDESTSAATDEPTEISLVPVTPATAPPAPDVELPDDAPTELTTTVLTEGSGRAAVDGDGVLVRYIGVSFETGDTFDSNFGGAPLPVVLGAGTVIAGWEQGLVGVQAGERLQLDIPSDLAYGDTVAASDTTTAGRDDPLDTTGDDTTSDATTSDATGSTSDVSTATSDQATTTTVAAVTGPPTGPLTFVIDVLAVVAPTDVDDAPTVDAIPTLCPRAAVDTTVPASSAPDDTSSATDASDATTPDTATPDTTTPDTTTPGSTPVDTIADSECDVHVDEVTTDDLVEGDGPAAELGQVAIINFVFARADNGVTLRSTWDNGQPEQITLIPGPEMSGMIEGMEGMRVGGRRAITVPYLAAFGENGFPTAGLPAETDVVVVVDLLGVYA